jgi:serine/threonine protein kinase
MTRDVLHDPSREARLNEILLACVESLQAGQALDQSHLLATHPEFQGELKAFFAGHEQVERIAAPFRQATRETGGGEILARGCSMAVVPMHGAEPGSALSGRTADIGQLGDFRLLRVVGRGGMGVVYEAEQISLRRRVALKVLPFAAAIDSRQLQRFQNEALAAAHLRHENIVPVYAVGSERGVHYYAMQFVEGESLASLIGELRRCVGNGEGRMTNDERSPNDESRMPKQLSNPDRPKPQETLQGFRHSTLELLSSLGTGHSSFFQTVARLGMQTALALEHAHERGIVHRDIKPANLLLDVQGQLWVTDFGLAQCSGSTGLTVTGELVGTLRYASPEQVLAKRGLVDHRTDIYSLGATLYELLTLRPIFDGRDRHELLRQIADAEPRPPRSLDKRIPEELETIILKAVAKEPGERYASAQDLADDLQRFREDRPIRARRPSALEKATKWARRHKGAVVSGIAVLLLLVAGMSVTTLLVAQAYEQERQARARAEQSFREAREAVDQFAQIGEDELAGKPLVEETRRRMLVTALDYYKNFIDQRHDDPSTCKELEASRAKVEKIVNELTTLMRMDQYTLLQQKAVQDLLKLTDDQRKEVAEIPALLQKAIGGFQELHANRGYAVAKLQQAIGGFQELHGSPSDLERQRLRLGQEQEKLVGRILDPNQLGRFRQIMLQSLGPAAFREPEVIEALKLTTAQCERIRAIEADTVVTYAVCWISPGAAQLEDHPRVLAKSELSPKSYEEVRTTALAQIQHEVLTPEQVQRWKKMIGEPVDRKILAPDRRFLVGRVQRRSDGR